MHKYKLGHKVIAFALVICVLLTLMPSVMPSALAKSISDGSTYVTIEKGYYGSYIHTTNGNRIGARNWIYTTNNGVTGPAYCVNHNLTAVDSTTKLTISGLFTSNPQTAGAFAAGYPQRSLEDFLEIYLPDNPELAGLTENEFANATQFSIWATLGQLAIEGTEFTQGSETIPVQTEEGPPLRIYRAIQIILDSAQWWTMIYRTSMGIRLGIEDMSSVLDIEMSNGIAEAAATGAYGIKIETINGTDYYTRTFVASSGTSTWKNDYFIEVWPEAAPEGTIITDLSNNILDRTPGGKYKVPTVNCVNFQMENNSEYRGEFKLCMPVRATPESGNVGLYATASVAQYNLYLANNTNSREQSYIIADPAYTELTGSAAVRWNKVTSPYGIVLLNKVNGQGSPLPGAIFRLKGNDGSVVEGTSNTNGEVKWEFLNPNVQYTLEEVQAPVGYIKAEPQTISVIAGQTMPVVVQNRSVQSVIIRKIDAQNGGSLKGAIFRFEQVDGGYVTDATTSHDGSVEFIGDALPFGTYKVYEIQAPDGYEKDDTVQTFKWDGTTSVNLTFKNVRKPTIVIVKTDRDNNDSLEGAVFNIYRDGRFITSVISDNAGYARVPGVSEGYYEIEEIQAPAGYVLDSTRHGIYVDPYNPATEKDPIIVITNERKPSLIIEKLDADTLKPMQGTTFAVYKDTVLIGEYTTDRDGLIELYDLEPGTYTVKEVRTDSGHVVQGCPQSIEVTKGEHRLVFFNQKKPGISIKKIDADTKEPLLGAVFRIARLDGTYIKEYTTDKYGEIDLSDLSPGTYTVTEIESPEGYVSVSESRVFEAVAGESVQLVFTNSRAPELEILKIDSDTGEPLEGAVFRIARIGDGTRYLDRETDRNGQIYIDGLEPGIYSIKETVAPGGYLIDPTEYHAELFEGKSSQVIIKNRIKPSLRIIKYDSLTGERMEGSHFAVYRDTELIGEYTTDRNGEIELRDLTPGTYFVQEIGTDNEHLVNSTPRQVEIRADSGDTAVLVFLNDQKPYIRLVKLDSDTLEPLQGAIFEIRSVGGTLVREYTTDRNGEIRLDNLSEGAYTVTEVRAPAGYVIDRSERVVQVNGNEYATFVFTDTKKPRLTVRKIDADTGKGLPGATIRISNTCSTEVYEKTTDSNGEITLDEIGAGVFTVREIAAPEGYLLNSEAQQFTAVAGNSYEIVLKNVKRPSLRIVKFDSLTGKPIKDTVFQVYRDASLIGTYTTNADGEILLYDLIPGTYFVQETATDSDHIVNSTPQQIEVKADSGDTAVLVFFNDQKPYIRLVKVDSETMKPLANAIFTVKGIDNDFYHEYSTDASGEIRLDGLDAGSYTVSEIKAPDGYVIDDSTRTISLDGNESATFIFTNTIKPKLKITKVDSVTGERLSCAVIRITNLSGTEIHEKTTDSKGEIVLEGINEGIYTVQEITAPDGYLLNSELFHVDAKAGGSYEITIPNTKKPSLRIKKYDSLNGKAMPGTIFNVARDTVHVGTYETDDNGEILLYNLIPGTYTVQEVAADNDHIVNSTPQSIEIYEDSADTAVLVFLNDQKPCIRIVKLDSQTMKPLPGAVFEVKGANGEHIGTYTTDENGEIQLDRFETGAYVITEVKAPDGYIIDDPGRVVEINGNEFATYVFTNTKKPSLKVVKVDSETGERLPGAVFRIDNLNTAEHLERTTDGNGEIFLDEISEGVYTVKEVTPPGGYLFNNETYYVDAKAGGTYEVFVPNIKRPSLRILKYDSLNGKPIPNTTFEVRRDTAMIGVYITDENGEIALRNLQPGTYTVTEIATDEDHVVKSNPQSVEITANSGDTAMLVFLNDQKPCVRIVKLDSETMKPLTGAVFEVNSVGGTFSGTYATDEDGEIQLTNLDEGSYVISEIKAPDGYVIDSVGRTVEFVGNDSATYVFTNTRKPTLRITKVDAETGTKLPNAVFRIESITGSEVYEKTTDQNGDIYFDEIGEGVYTVQEIAPPEGYLLNSELYHIEAEAGKSYELVVPNIKRPSLRIVKYDSLNGLPMPGATFEVYRDTVLIGTHVTNENGEILLYNLEPGTYTVKEIAVDDSHVVNSTPQSIEITENSGNTAVLVFLNDQKPYIRIVKLDNETMKPLPGAIFTVRSVGGTFDREYTTDESGEILIEKLGEDTYIISEKSAPDGYLIDHADRVVEVNGNEYATFVFTDTKKPTLRITKVDTDTGKRLPGAIVRITNLSSSFSIEKTTDENGEVNLDGLEPGIYTVQEITPPDGYLLNGEVYYVKAEAGGHYEVIIPDTRRPSLLIRKFDSLNGLPMPGVKFEIYRDTVLIGTYITDENGEVQLYGLQPGTYTVKEVAVDDGHIVNSTPQSIEITADSRDTAVLIFLNDQKPYIRLVKLDSETMQPLPGAVFVFKEIGGSFEQEYTTDENGEIRLDKLPTGAYTVTETRAPGGYLIDSAERTIEINGNEYATFVFTDTKKPTLKILKYDGEKGVYLPGAVFRIAKIEDGSRYLDRTTDENGCILIDELDPGTYSIKEIEAPNGYVLVNREYHVELFPGKESQIIIVNEEKPSLKIIKTNALTGEPIAGVGFLVRHADGSTENTVVTDENGEAVLSHLEEGIYEVIEKSVPAGYLIDNNPKLVTLEANRTSVVRFENYPTPGLTINKVDSVTGDPLKGAKFSVIYASNNTSTGENTDLGSYMTDENGRIHLYNLRDGWYKITETSAPAGYALAEENVQEFFISAGENKEVTFTNTPLSAIIIKKVDADTGAVLQGAKFRLRYFEGVSGTGGTVIGEYMTSANGTVVITGLAAGTYIVEETQAPAGYEITEPEKTVYISGEEQASITVEFADKAHGQVIVQKLDSVTKQPLAGAEFLITTADGAYVPNAGGSISSNGYYVTDEYGQIRITGVKPGTVLVITETKAPDGYELETVSQTVEVSANDTQTITFFNKPNGGLLITKLDAHTGAPLRGAVFKITASDGSVVGDANGRFTTDREGTIYLYDLPNGTYVVTEVTAPDGYTLDSTPQTIQVNSGRMHELTFYNEPIGGLRITKIDEETRQPIRGVEFEVEYMNGQRVGSYRTDSNGVITINDLPNGWYTIIEKKAASGYMLDSEPHDVEVKDGKITRVTLTNRKNSAFLIHKMDSVTGAGIYGVTFLISDSSGRPVAQYTTDQNGYVYTDDRDFADGKYFIREISVPQGYVIDPEIKTFYVEYGKTSSIIWYNTPTLAQIKITKKSADYNQINGLPAGSLLEGAVFEIYDRGGNVVDTIRSDSNGRASSKTLPLGLYTVREVQAPTYYSLNDTVITANLEFSGQIVSFEVLDKSVSTGVSIIKSGYNEVMPDNPVVYTFTDIANTSTVALDSFYWRDTLSSAIRCEKLVTGTYNQQLSYKIVYRTNLSEEYRTINDNLSTGRNYALDISNAALGLASDEYLTEIMFVFGRVNAGFAQVENPYLYARTVPGLPHGSSFVNQADVGGVYDGQWITSISRWVTKIYNYTQFDMPRTGY